MNLSDFVHINPKVKIQKGLTYPCVMMEDIDPGRRYVKARLQREFKGGSVFQSGDTLFARITPCLENGKIAQFTGLDNEEAFGSTEFIVLRARAGVSDPGYIFYLALSDMIRKPAEKSMSGASGRQRADLNVISKIDVRAPTLSVQQTIASVLSAYDNEIENNCRRAAALEELILSTYREWFIEFRAPGIKLRKASPEEKRATGKAEFPDGWELARASDAINTDLPVRVTKDGERPFVTMSALSQKSMVISPIQRRIGANGSKFKNGDTLFARITPCLENGKIGFVQFLPTPDAVACGSTEFIVLRSRTLCPEYVYCLARSDSFRAHAIKSMSGASGRQRVQVACFDKFVFAHPPAGLIICFQQVVSPMFRMVDVLVRKNESLLKTRDVLLPRMLSGEIMLELPAAAGAT
jgi:type I restriction enzyme, S subunit